MGNHIYLYIFVMAGVTYLVRMLPLAIFQKEITSKFVQSFLFYMPYAVLGAMTFPAVFTATASIWSALAGLVVAILLSLREKDLLTVAMAACFTAFLVEWMMRFMQVL